MSEHQKQTAFFKSLVRQASTPAQRQLREKILRAEGDVRCCCRAMFWVLLLVALSLIGGLYTAVIMPEVLLQHDNTIKKVFEILTIGSVISLAMFSGFWLYYRAVLFQVHSECRRLLYTMISRETSERHDPIESQVGILTPAH